MQKTSFKKSKKNISNIVNITDYRDIIDKIDIQLLALFEERMKIAEEIAEFKKNNNKKIVDKNREEELIKRLSIQASPELWNIDEKFFRAIIRLSCEHQQGIIDKTTDK